ncbi:mucin-5AC [Hyaena hyaena]|uniref:mucin-5AC n=1 Tax=Hyaena hyaena TaxID=95912 RepID=UPI001921136F|nr:mucin-5AC [Hyaena hyaena]
MGAGRRKLAPLWALALTLACAQHTGSVEHGHKYPHLSPVAQEPAGDQLRRVTILPPLRTAPVVRALNPAHNGRVCSTWGDFHYKTFDGDVFRFPGLCNYVFSAHCGAAYEDFNVQVRRGLESNVSTPVGVTMKLDGMVIQLTKGSIQVNGRPIQPPFSQSGVVIEHTSGHLKVVARLGLVFMWGQDGSLLLELDAKYSNQTCGLCGDFNGVPVFNEFLSHGVKLTPIEFGNLQKMDGPTEQCQDPVPVPLTSCSLGTGICEELLSSHPFWGCNALVDAASYVQACQQDLCLCHLTDLTSCVCHTVAEYSRQCAHAGGQPLDWRAPDLCPQTCPSNMQYRECGSPCADTCSNPEHSQLCEEHCMAGCFCPEGTVLDDIGQTGCIPASQCACVYNGAAYAPGTVYSTGCTNCTCSGGRWTCREVPCPGACSVLGGSHFSTFDERQYTVHGDCSYVLAKPCDSSAFTVLAELRRCGLTDSETCLKSLTLSLDGGHTVITVKAGGEVFVNQIYTQTPISAANVTLFRPSTFFIIAQTNLGLQVDIQLVPTMQVFVRLAPELRGLTCGLCGNFNQNQADDFRALSGVVEGTAAAFANTWKTQAACPNVKNTFEDPCSLSVENEKYAQHWCSRLTDPHGPFVQCHAAVSPSTYHSNCMFDTCNCQKSEDCLCAALSAYVHACAAKGVLLSGWRDGVCTKPMATCPKSLTYHYHISTCQPTCRARNHEDVTCGISFVPVDGCACPQGTFMDEAGKCVPATSCPCYHEGSVVPSGESLHERGAVCTCTQGLLTCIGGQAPAPVCTPPMVYVDCRNATPGAAGASCQKSCFTLDMDCYSSRCEPGCVCPDGLVADGEGGCVAVEDCPCVHDEASYLPGQTIWVGCNTCTCKNRMWQCTHEPCLATCAVYGDSHYLTFDGQRYSFSGDCEYTLLQDHCGQNGTANGTFRVVTENVPCGTTGVTCSKAIKLFLGSYELRLSGGHVEVIQKGEGQEAPYSIRQMGIYLVVDTEAGLVLLWDRKTTIFLKLSPEFKGRVCGLCGNFDDNAVNDFTTRSQSVVGNALEFGNSWKFSPSCPDAPAPRDPCTANPYRKSWAQKQCSILTSATFAACHAHVEPAKYYEACVGDACACDSGGDCECLCTAVAAYAQACHDVGVCVSWRTPDICPLFCDYYNREGQCEWHYRPCGAPCMRTCRNPSGRCLHDLRGLEGCYPKCPPEAPIFDEDQMQCVAVCPTPSPPPPCRVQGKSYRPGETVPSDKNCQSCVCTESGVQCAYDTEACVCIYDGRRFRPGDVIYHTTDGTGGCISAHCLANGTIDRRVYICSPSTPAPPTTFSFSTFPLVVSSTRPSRTCHSSTKSTAPPSTRSSTLSSTPGTTSSPPTSSLHPRQACGEDCQWSPWLDVSHPGRGIDSGDFDTLDNIRAHGYKVCPAPQSVECRAEGAPEVPIEVLGQHVECSPTRGLTCYNRKQASGLCHNYQIRIQCCSPRACLTTTPATSRTTETEPTQGYSHTRASDHDTHLKYSHTCANDHDNHPKYSHTCASHHDNHPNDHDNPPKYSYTHLKYSHTCASHHDSHPKYSHTRASDHDTHPKYSHTHASDHDTHPKYSHTCPRHHYSSEKHPLDSESNWFDSSYPEPGINGGDFDTFQDLRSKGHKFCEKPSKVECRAQFFPNVPLEELGQDVICDKRVGLMCLNRNQLPPICYNYEIRIECCELVDVCGSTTHPVTNQCNFCAENQPDVCARNQHNLRARNQHNFFAKNQPDLCARNQRNLQTSATSVPKTSATSVPETSATSVPHTSPTSVPQTSATSVPHTSPTSVPQTSPTSVLTSAATHSPPVTVTCQPQCRWTKWFDVDVPSPGPHGGDVETFDNIVRRGEKICRRPEYIAKLECRAESHPDVSIESLDQVVECSVSKGLVCRNQDQDDGGTCLNYEVRVLCCEPCPRTPVTSHVTPPTKPSSPPEPTSVVSTVPSPSSRALSTTTCYCSVSDKLYPAGSIIYQETDLAGHCYYAACSLDCHVVRTDGTCASSTPPSTPSTSRPGTSPSASITVTEQGCPNAVPPRTKGETWAMPNCSQATCEGNGVITLQPRQCPRAQRPTCANGYPPVKVVDQDSCCPQYQCQCVCSGWGDPHYITFDGTYYTFLDNCTYVLVQQILPVYGHFRVLIDNYFCGAQDGLSCPQSIIVEYQQDRVVLTRKPVRGVMTNEIIFNDQVVKPDFQKDSLSVSQIGIKMYLTIPELGVRVMFSGLLFSVELPFSKFANNTEGQCGTCTNDRGDECRLPGGAVAASCSSMSGHWKVTAPHQPSCHGAPPTPTAVGPAPSPTPCSLSPVCQLILSKVFERCHRLIPPLPFYQGCAFDHCHLSDLSVLCSGLELYASLCASRGVCVDWRSHTNHTCPFACPADKVYLPCGPSKPSYCYGNDTSLVALQDAVPITEGCFCPEDKTLFSMSSQVCVPAGCHRCLGPRGEAVEPGHTIVVDCQRCTCESSTLTMSCHREPCPLPPACPLPGFVPVPAAPQAGQCCPQYSCACDTSYCPKSVACPEGSHPIVTYEEGACCPSQNCSWSVCSVNGTLYQPGSVVSSSLCETCRCEVSSSPQLDTVVINCETQICTPHCPVGFEYQERSEQCCGVCVQQACVVNASDGSTHVFSPGQSWSDPKNPCVTHECEKHRDGLVVVARRKACPPLNCPAAQAQLSEDGCCPSCPHQPQNSSMCAVYHKLEVIRQQGCSSVTPVSLAYCQGNCGDSGTKYSLEANTMQRNCHCCQELRVSRRTVALRCAGGSSRDFSYWQVEECGCRGQRCSPHRSPGPKKSGAGAE